MMPPTPTTQALRALESVPPVRSAALAHHVHARLRSDILFARLRPGQALSENQLAQQLGVSRTPVREAIQALVREHLVVVQPQRGTRVARLSMQRIREALFVREAVESHVIRMLLARPLTPQHQALIDHCLARHRCALAAGELENTMQADADFHHSLLTLCGMEGVWPVVAHARDLHQRVRAIAVPELQSGHQALQDHLQIVHALRSGDAAQATLMIGRHLQHNETLTRKIADLHPDYFEEEHDADRLP
jgi:DNA-binding GntR family transcriptional regulator